MFNFFKKNKKVVYETRKVDFLYHLVIAIARIMKINPRALSRVSRDVQGNIEYISEVLKEGK